MLYISMEPKKPGGQSHNASQHHVIHRHGTKEATSPVLKCIGALCYTSAWNQRSREPSPIMQHSIMLYISMGAKKPGAQSHNASQRCSTSAWNLRSQELSPILHQSIMLYISMEPKKPGAQSHNASQHYAIHQHGTKEARSPVP